MTHSQLRAMAQDGNQTAIRAIAHWYAWRNASNRQQAKANRHSYERALRNLNGRASNH